MTSPPAITTGLSLAARNGSLDCILARLSDDADGPGTPLEKLMTLLLRLLTAPILPYPSWPVPAAGPFRGSFSFLSTDTSASVFRRPNSPNRALKVETFGLGVRVGLLFSVLLG